MKVEAATQGDDGDRWALMTRWIEGERAPREGLVALLQRTREPLFAILDAARDRRVLALLRASGAEARSLYDGAEGQVLAEEAPYLVRVPPDSRLLPVLVRGGWGESWGVYLTSRRPFSEVRRSLRRFLMVTLSTGRKVYFRFYDPRVLRDLLPVATPLRVSELFAEVVSYVVEADGGRAALCFTREGDRARLEEVTP